MCSFWLADVYVLLGRQQEAQALYERLVGLCNDVGLLAEQYDPVGKRMLGNFPQAFSHIGIINTALNLHRAQCPVRDRAEFSDASVTLWKRAQPRWARVARPNSRWCPMGLPVVRITGRQHHAGCWQMAGVVVIAQQLAVERVVVAIEQVLDAHAHLVVRGDPVLADQIHGRVGVDRCRPKLSMPSRR